MIQQFKQGVFAERSSSVIQNPTDADWVDYKKT